MVVTARCGAGREVVCKRGCPGGWRSAVDHFEGRFDSGARVYARASIEARTETLQRTAEGRDGDDGIDRLGGRTHVTDAQELAQGLAAACGEDDAKMRAYGRAQRGILDAGGNADGSGGRRGDALVRRPEPQAHGERARATGLRGERVTSPDMLGPLREIQIEGGVETVHLGDRRGERERPIAARGVLPVE